MSYFQYDALRRVARFVTLYQWERDDSDLIRYKTGLEFTAPVTHAPWRNYSRIFKLCLLVSEKDDVIVPTPVAVLLAQVGAVTCDEYLHFVIEATTDPSPALVDWESVASGQPVRHPLCFVLKYLLAKNAGLNESSTSIYEVIGAYANSGFSGSEDDGAFLDLMRNRITYEKIGRQADARQARESIKFISQISYLHSDRSNIIVSLSQEDSMNVFQGIRPMAGPYEVDGNLEIRRLAGSFKEGGGHDFFNYAKAVASDVIDSGFSEGGKVKKTHVILERNMQLRSFFFDCNPTTICDACSLDTKKKYSWAERVLDLHHILPLSSGTRVHSSKGTVLEDLVPVCPTCHRAIHRFYDDHLKSAARQDFMNEEEARDVYAKAKREIANGNCYV